MRARMLLACAAMVSLVVLTGCAVPYQFVERARITPGLSGSAQVGGAGVVVPKTDSEARVLRSAGLGAGSLRYGLSPDVALFLRGMGGYSDTALSAMFHEPFGRAIFDFQLGVKLRHTEQSAVQVAAGLPSFLDIRYLQDFGDAATANLGIGMRGLSCGLALRRSLSSKADGFVGIGSGVTLHRLTEPEAELWCLTLTAGIEGAESGSTRRR